MKKNIFLALALLLLLALVTSACTLPAPGGAPQATESQPEVVEEPTLEATASAAEVSGEVATSVPPTAYPLPAEPTDTAVPPTAVPTATEAATAVPLPEAQRIQFLPSATSATVDGELDSGATASYLLSAASGQTMSVQVWSPNGDVYLSIMGSDRQVLLDDAASKVQWNGTLDSAQDYYLTVRAGNGRTSYSLTVISPVTQPTPQATASSLPAFDPYKTYGKPSFEDTMDKTSIIDWALLDGTLPNTQNIRLFVEEDNFLVTGKQLDYSTWWFNWASMQDFYLEMTVDSRTCAASDAYGLILRGPEHQAGVSYGYVVSFTCDGKLWVFRLDGIEPWDSTDLHSPTTSATITKGANATNVIGVKAIGDTLTIYANGNQVVQLVDKHYLEGRYGLFVRPDVTDFYTYEVVKIAYWLFEK